MVKNRTVFILGAGASHEVKMPTGEGLKNIISNYLKFESTDFGMQVGGGDKLIFNALNQYSQNVSHSLSFDELLSACEHISEAMPQVKSIDSFMELHNENKAVELVGKVAIVRSILEHEKKSLLWVNRQEGINKPSLNNLKDTWYTPFLHILTETCPLKSLPERLSLLTVVDFNYDRCFEQYLFYALQNLYKISGQDAAAVMNEIEIYHPYGSVGSLPWQRKENPIQYGDTPQFNALVSLSSQIKTYSEGTNSRESAINTIRQRLVEARFVIFLGFAFHRQNMQLLKPEGLSTKNSHPTYFGTALDNSSNNISLIETDIFQLLGAPTGGMHIENRTCCALLREHSRYLSLSFRN